ncbi:MAG: STAS domain-containing protein [Actinomycetota bacterium]|nr:STAS domain-containing protein [Actinomycetota bacterium]
MTAMADRLEVPSGALTTVIDDDLVLTTHSDDWRATIQIRSEPCWGLPEHVRRALESHLAVDRVLLRIDVSAVERLDEEVIEVLVDAHLRMLLRRGTFVIVGASPGAVEAISATPGGERLLVQARR